MSTRALVGLAVVAVVTGAIGAALVPQASAGAGARPSTPQVVYVTWDCATNFTCPAFKDAVRVEKVSARVVSPTAKEDAIGTLSLIARQGHDLVITDFNWAEQVSVVARRFPKVRFALIDWVAQPLSPFPPNVRVIEFRPTEAAFLAGFLATRMEQRRRGPDVVGVVGGIPVPPVDAFVDGFDAGARHASGTVKVLVGYSGDFVDESKCEAVARSLIAKGAGVVFDVAGSCGPGTLRAARRAGVWGIGVDNDQSFRGSHILTSVLKRYEVGFVSLFDELRAGTFRGGASVMSLRNAGTGLGRISARVPSSVRRELESLRTRLAAGKLRVPGAGG